MQTWERRIQSNECGGMDAVVMDHVCLFQSDLSVTLKAHAHGDYWPPTRYVKLRVAHAPRISGTFSPPSRLGSQTSGFLWSRWRGRRSRHSRNMRNPQSYVSQKRPMVAHVPDDYALAVPAQAHEVVLRHNTVTTKWPTFWRWYI